jgi:phosphopantothenoylcysteine decarboxylase/phosphopantothenate--cysteine ligase
VKILVTSGATREPIDAVRFISNASTGATGAALADGLAARGHRVTLLHGTGATRPATVRDIRPFTTAENLREQMRKLLGSGNYDAVIQCAAIADYRPARARMGKPAAGAAGLTLRLVPTPKLLPALKGYARKPLLVVGFKLTAGAGAKARAAAVARLWAAGPVDAVIQNDLTDLAAGAHRTFRAYRAASARPQVLRGVPALIAWVGALCAQFEI